MRRTVMPALVLVTGLALGLGTTAQAAVPTHPSRPASPPASHAATRTEMFTLPTGDRVVWPSRQITPARGRDRIEFSTYDIRDHVYVVPSDVMRQVFSGKLDRRLFDITTLREHHITDARHAKLPPVPKPTASRAETAEETHTLAIDVLDRNGEPAQNSGTWLVGLDSDYEMLLDGPTFQAELPEGRYLLDSQITTTTANGEERTRLVQPLIVLDQDTTISADARVAQPLEITVPEASAELADGQIHFRRFVDGRPVYGGQFTLFDLAHHFTAQLGPTVPSDELEVYVDGQWARPSGSSEYWERFFDTPYIYGLIWREAEFPTGLRKTVDESDLATVTSRQFASAGGARSTYRLYSRLGEISSSSGEYQFDLPATVTLHLSAGSAQWSGEFFEQAPPFDPTQASTVLNYLNSGKRRSFVAGQNYRETWNSAVLGPEIPTRLRPAPDYTADPWPWFARNGDFIAAGAPLLSDRAGNVNIQEPYAGVENLRTALYRDDALVQEIAWYGYIEAYGDPAPAKYRLETSFERPKADVSTKVSAAWTFNSAHTDGVAALPVSTIQFAPAVNERNQVAWKPTYTVPVTVQRQAGSTAGPVRSLDVDVSIDDGQTWIDTKLTRAGANRWLATVSTPPGSHITIRAKSTDTRGNTVEQTITRAYGLS